MRGRKQLARKAAMSAVHVAWETLQKRWHVQVHSHPPPQALELPRLVQVLLGSSRETPHAGNANNYTHLKGFPRR